LVYFEEIFWFYFGVFFNPDPSISAPFSIQFPFNYCSTTTSLVKQAEVEANKAIFHNPKDVGSHI
jgi:hypothetical protein